jgi:hypothetical protein
MLKLIFGLVCVATAVTVERKKKKTEHQTCCCDRYDFNLCNSVPIMVTPGVPTCINVSL